MITLYHCAGSRSFRALWALEELGVPYVLKMIPFPPRAHVPNYLEVNPLGTVPALYDGDQLMTESAAITQYLVTRYGPSSLAVAPDEPDYATWLNFLHMGEATLTFPQTLYLRYALFEPDERKQPQVAGDYVQWFLSRLKGVAVILGDREYLAADRFTAADISVAYALRLASERLGVRDKFPPNIAAYWARMSARSGYLKAGATETGDPRAGATR